MNNLFRGILFLGLLIHFSCKNQNASGDEPQSQSDNTAPSVDASSLNFDETIAYNYIQKQVDFGPRNPSSKGHNECATWLLQTLKSLADTAYIQNFDAITYDAKKHKGKNIIAKTQPNNPNRILLCAHWDTRPIADHDVKNQTQPILGANDAGSGVGIILAILESLKTKQSKIGIDIVFFDLEDYGQPENSGLPPMENSWCLGSQYWSKNTKHTYLPRWGILLDMVGGKNATFLKEELSQQFSGNLLQRLWSNAQSLGYGAYFLSEPMGQITDDHVYINTQAGIPTIDIIHYKVDNGGFADYWHTHNDNMNSVDKQTLKAVGNSVLYTIRQEENFIQ